MHALLCIAQQVTLLNAHGKLAAICVALQQADLVYAAGETVTLKLKDPTSGPVENARVLFKRAAKQRRAVQHLEPLMAEAQEQLDYIAEVQGSLSLLDKCAHHARILFCSA